MEIVSAKLEQEVLLNIGFREKELYMDDRKVQYFTMDIGFGIEVDYTYLDSPQIGLWQDGQGVYLPVQLKDIIDSIRGREQHRLSRIK